MDLNVLSEFGEYQLSTVVFIILSISSLKITSFPLNKLIKVNINCVRKIKLCHLIKKEIRKV